MGKYDEIWKIVIEEIFQHFVTFYMPDLAEDIDFTKPYTFLDKEFATIEENSDDSTRYMDKLIKVYLKNGNEQWVLLHVDVQQKNETSFSERMFRYFYRIYDKYNRKIVSQIIFTGKADYQKEFNYSFYNTELNYKYRSLRLVDYDETKLLEQNNPFALATLAVKYAMDSTNDDDLRYNFRKNLMRLMLTRGYNHDDIKTLFRFIGTMLELPKHLCEKLYTELRTLVKEEDIMVITDFEEMFMEKEKINIAKRLLLKNYDIQEISEITELPIEEIQKLIDKK